MHAAYCRLCCLCIGKNLNPANAKSLRAFIEVPLNVPLLIAHPKFSQKLIKTPVQTTQIAPTILEALRIDPDELEAGAEGAHGRATSLTEQKRISR